VEHLKKIFYSLIILLVLGGLLYWLRGQDLRDTFLLYLLGALVALAFFHQTYLLIYGVFHRGVTATPNTAEKATAVTETSDLQKVEKNQTPRWKAVSFLFITTLVLGSLTYWYGAPRSSHDELPLYFFGGFALVALAFFHQTYLLIYDVFHRGVIAALNTVDETPAVTKKSDVQKVEDNKMPTQQHGAVKLQRW
jgi:hypothetical protein